METKFLSYKTVDDYEHEGDLHNELEAFYGLNIKVIRTEPGNYDNPAPTIYYEIPVTDDKIANIVTRLGARIDRAKRTGDYSYCMHPGEIIWILQEIDKKIGSSYYVKYADELTKMVELYS